MNSGVQTCKYLDAIKDYFIFHALEGSPELLAYHCYGDAYSCKVLSSDKFHLPFSDALCINKLYTVECEKKLTYRNRILKNFDLWAEKNVDCFSYS